MLLLLGCHCSGEDELEATVRLFLAENVRRGQKMTAGYLKSVGLNVTRKRVRECLSSIDPEGVRIRETTRLKRRVYSVPGSNYLWHMDGNHKLIRFGFVVHAAIDGFSRYIVFIKCGDNNRASSVLSKFKDGCREMKLLPRRLRTDKGGENRHVCSFLLETFGADSDCCITGKSTGNQRVERLFRDSTEQALCAYISLFEDFVLLGFNIENRVQMFVLHYLFMDRINESLIDFRNAWNNHKIRTENNKTPIQLLVAADLENNNHGIILSDTDMLILEDTNTDSNEYLDNQVVCDSPFCPFHIDQLNVFVSRVIRVCKEETFTTPVLFDRFINAMSIANEILSSSL
jgi:hypothetical protein